MSLVLLILFSCTAVAQTGTHAGTLYSLQDANQTKPIYKFYREKRGAETITRFYDAKGELVVEERAVTDNGSLRSYSIDQKLLSEFGSAELKDGRVTYRYRRQGHEKEDSEKSQKNLVFAPDLLDFIKKHWKAFLESKELTIRFGVLDRLTSYEFELLLEDTVEEGGKKLLKVRMKPSNFFVNLAVAPIYLYLEKETQEIVRTTGTTPFKANVDGRWEQIEALTILEN